MGSEPMAKDWLVWSNEHRAWWAPNRQGYVHRIEKAGRYSKAETDLICLRAESIPYPYEVAVPTPEAITAAKREALEEANARENALRKKITEIMEDGNVTSPAMRRRLTQALTSSLLPDSAAMEAERQTTDLGERVCPGI